MTAQRVLEPGPSPRIHRRDDGTVWAETPFPDVVAIARSFLDGPLDRKVIEWRGSVVDIRLANGRWVYEILEWRDDGRTAICEIRYREEGH